MINPIKHFNAVCKAAKPSKKIQPRVYTEGYFMKPSPLAKNNVPQNNTSFLDSIKKFLELVNKCNNK